MSSQREVLIRILALLQRKTLLETKKVHIKVFWNGTIRLCNQWKMLQCWLRTGYLPSFSPPMGICHPTQKNANARGSARGGGGLGAAGIDWCITQINFNHVNKIEARQKVLSLNEKLSEVQRLRLRATFHACLNLVARENYTTLEINPKLELNLDCASGGQGKNKGRQSETLTSYIKITYLNKELWNIFQWRSPFWGLVWAQLCQHV